MKFIEENKLKDAFWSKYGYRNNILRYQFECPIRNGGIDLLTIEEYDERIMIVAFEFKLNDIKKTLAQAQENIKYVHKSFVVVPSEKLPIIKDKYEDWLRRQKYIGVIGVDLDGRWHITHKAQLQNDESLSFNQTITRLMLDKIK